MTTYGGGAIPGWYPDPYDPSQLRYWDGATWTESAMPAGGPPQQPYGYNYGAPAAGGSGLGDVGSWLSDTFSSLMRRAGPLVLLIYVVPVLATALVLVLARSVVADIRWNTVSDSIEGFEPVRFIPVGMIAFVVAVVAALCWLAAYHQMDASHRGRPAALVDSLGVGARRLPRAIFWYVVLSLALVILLAVLIGLPVVLAVAVSPGFAALAVVSVLAMFPLAILLMAKMAFFGPAVVMAPSGVNPIGESWRLSAGRFGAVLGRVLLLAIIAVVVSFIGQFPVQILATVVGETLFGFETDPATGELLIDGQLASDLDVIEFGSFIPSALVLVLLVAVNRLVSAAAQAIAISGTSALYVRAGGATDLAD